jgi:DNA-directed RNA polymerase subunit RPC12/RpoP
MKKKAHEEVLQLVAKGIAAAQAERKEEAEEWLRQAIALDPDNERAWLWLSAVVEGIERQRECLQRVLKINPSNSFARTGLAFLSHLREGYEYLAARAPWMAGVEDSRTPLERLPPQRCPRCRHRNPGWAYICNRCGAPLQRVDVRQIVRQELRATGRPSWARAWAGAAILDPELAFASEIALASPMRSFVGITLGAIVLTLARWFGTLALAAFSSQSLPLSLLNRLSLTFLLDLVGLLIGAFLVWIGLGVITESIARSRGGAAPSRVHYYLIAVAISSWMSIAGILVLIGWGVIYFVPTIPERWILAGMGGVLFLYAVMLVVQAVRTAHRLRPGSEAFSIGFIMLAAVSLYGLLTAIAPPALQNILLTVIRVVMLPMQAG